MRQYKMLFVGLITGAILATAGTSFAESAMTEVKAFLRPDFTVQIDGKKAELTNTPLIYEGSSYLPVREIAGLLGKEVDFQNNTITLNSKGADNMSTTVPIEQTFPKNLEGWIRFTDVIDKFGSSFDPRGTVSLKNKTGESITLPIYYGMPNGDTTVQTDKGQLRIKVFSDKYILINSEDLIAIGFYPQ